MNEQDFYVGSEDEFYEDFSGWEITDEELDEMLTSARNAGDVPLRRLVKQYQYFRWLLRQLLIYSDQNDDLGVRKMLDFARPALKSTTREKDDDHRDSDSK